MGIGTRREGQGEPSGARRLKGQEGLAPGALRWGCAEAGRWDGGVGQGEGWLREAEGVEVGRGDSKMRGGMKFGAGVGDGAGR